MKKKTKALLENRRFINYAKPYLSVPWKRQSYQVK